MKRLGLGKTTVLRWEKEGKIPEAHRDEMGWRYWTEEEFEQIIRPTVRTRRPFLPELSKSRPEEQKKISLEKGLLDHLDVSYLRFGFAAIFLFLSFLTYSAFGQNALDIAQSAFNNFERGFDFATKRTHDSGAFLGETLSLLEDRGRPLDAGVANFFESGSRYFGKMGAEACPVLASMSLLQDGISFFRNLALENFVGFGSSVISLQDAASRNGRELAQFSEISGEEYRNFARALERGLSHITDGVPAMPRVALNASLLKSITDDGEYFFTTLGRALALVLQETVKIVQELLNPEPEVVTLPTPVSEVRPQESPEVGLQAAPPSGVTIVDSSRTIQRTIECIIEREVAGVSKDDLNRVQQALDQKIRDVYNTVAISQRINTLGSPSYPTNSIVIKTIEVTERININGVAGLTDADIPNDITVSNYLALAGGTLIGALIGTDLTLSGNLTVSGAQILSGAITIPYFSATSTTQASTIDYRLGIGTTTPGSILSVQSIANFQAPTSTLYTGLIVPLISATTSATSTFTGGISTGGLASSNGVTLTGGALAGRVPVKVSLEGGPIHKGDRITSSSVSGIGMKANRPGYVLGQALSDFDSQDNMEQGMVLVAINLGFDMGIGELINDIEGNITDVVQAMLDLADETFEKGANLVKFVVEKIVARVAVIENLFVRNVTLLPGSGGITLFDEDTGEPYCIKIKSGNLISSAGNCQGASSTPAIEVDGLTFTLEEQLVEELPENATSTDIVPVEDSETIEEQSPLLPDGPTLEPSSEPEPAPALEPFPEPSFEPVSEPPPSPDDVNITP